MKATLGGHSGYMGTGEKGEESEETVILKCNILREREREPRT